MAQTIANRVKRGYTTREMGDAIRNAYAIASHAERLDYARYLVKVHKSGEKAKPFYDWKIDHASHNS